MIIECQTCRARFKLDEARIKGKGARIRCRKCGESIIVMKSDLPATPPSPPAAQDLLDLRAILDAPEPERTGAPRDEVDAAFDKIFSAEPKTMPASAREEKAPAPPEEKAPTGIAQPPEVPGQPPARPSREEIDASFDRIFSPEPETMPAAAREEKAPAPPEAKAPGEPAQSPEVPGEAPARLSREEVDAAFEELLREDREPETIPRNHTESDLPRGEIDAAFESPLFSEADLEPPPPPATEEPAPDWGAPITPGGTAPPDRSIEELFGTPPPEKSGSGAAREPETPLELDRSTSDYLRSYGVAGKPDQPLDISGQLDETPLRTPEGDLHPASPAPEPGPGPEEAPSSRLETIQGELAELAERRRLQEEARGPASHPPQVPPPPAPPRGTEVPPLPLTEMERAPAARRRPPPAPPRRTSITLLVLLLFVLAGGGMYLAFLDPEQESLHAIFSAVEYLRSGGKEPVQPFKVENLTGSYETSGKGGKLYVVKGIVINQGAGKSSGIRVRAELLDGTRQTIAEKTAYAGNVIHDLNSADRDQIEIAMANRFGDKLINVDIPQGHAVPFMVVFSDPPEGIEEYRVEALKGE